MIIPILYIYTTRNTLYVRMYEYVDSYFLRLCVTHTRIYNDMVMVKKEYDIISFRMIYAYETYVTENTNIHAKLHATAQNTSLSPS